MSARTVADVIGRLDVAMWMPRIKSWEIAQTNGAWGAHAEVAADDSVDAVMALTKLASEVGSKVVESTGRLVTVEFAYQDVPVRVWWLMPLLVEDSVNTPSRAQGLTPDVFFRLQSAVGVMIAARRQHGEGMVPLAQALESAGLLQSPESAAEAERLREHFDKAIAGFNAQSLRVTELEQQLTTARTTAFRQASDAMAAQGYEDGRELLASMAAAEDGERS